MAKRPGAGLAVFAVLVGTPALAGALTVADLIELSRAGVADDVLVELIGLDTAQPAPTTAEMLDLQEAAVSRPVLVAFLRNARRNAPPESASGARVWDAPPVASDSGAADVDVTVAPSQVVNVAQPSPFPYGPGGAVTVPVYLPFYVPIWGAPAPAPPHPRANVPAGPTLDQQPGFGRFMNNGWRPGPAPSVWTVGEWRTPR